MLKRRSFLEKKVSPFRFILYLCDHDETEIYIHFNMRYLLPIANICAKL